LTFSIGNFFTKLLFFYYGLPIKQKYTSSGEEGSSISTVTKTHEFVFQVIPAVVIRTGMEKFDPYARFGFSIGAYNAIYEKETKTVGNIIYESAGRYYGGVPLGYSVAGGVEWNVCSHFNVYGEIQCNGFKYNF